jgi:galactose mutarotase-like enzyme
MKPANGPGFLYRDKRSVSAVLRAGKSRYRDGGPFLCIEPCRGLTDNHEQRAFEAFEDKGGIQTISSGGELRASFSITPQLASCD